MWTFRRSKDDESVWVIEFCSEPVLLVCNSDEAAVAQLVIDLERTETSLYVDD